MGAVGLWFGTANPLFRFPLAALLYPASLFVLGTAATSAKTAFRQGWICGLTGASACLYWVTLPVHDFGGLPWALAVPCALLLGAYIGFYGGLFASLAHAVRREPTWRAVLLLGLGWYMLEAFRGWFLTGFPWLALASAFAPWPALLQSASWIGGYGLGGLLAGLACLAAETVRRGGGFARWRPLGAAVLLLAVLFGWGWLEPVPATNAPGVNMALVQGNLDQSVKWEPSMQRLTVQRYLALSAQALSVPAADAPEVILWPETSMPFNYQLHAELSPKLRQFARERGVSLLFGAPGFRRNPDGETATFNRAYLVSPQGTDVAWYEKKHLVPFGEYLPPFLDFPFLYQLLQGVGEFMPGERTAPLAVSGKPDGQPLVLGLLICYESIFPELAREQVAEGASVLANISNDAWFGRSSAPRQHLDLGILRAVEQRRWLVRATNTGISAFVSPRGEVIAHSGLFTAETLSHAVVPTLERTVFFVVQPCLPWAALVLFGLLALPLRRRNPS